MKTAVWFLTCFVAAILAGMTVLADGCLNPEFAAVRAITNWPGLARAQVVADFNGDGISDFATANNFTGTVAVAFGNGDGTLQTNVSYTVGMFPVDIVVGDFNHDGTNDLATANFENNLSHKISVLLGKGDGTFQTNVFYGTAATPFQLAVVDFNGDGDSDLVTVSTTNYEVLYGNGNGTFQPATTVAPASSQQFAVGDFNGDGTNDLVAAIGSSSDGAVIQVLFNNGAGGLVPGLLASAGGTNPTHVVVSDFNRDGQLDVAVANHDTDSVAVLLGQGGGQFQAVVTYPTGHQPVRIAAGDFNGDGTNDLAVADEGFYTITVVLNNGNGSFLTQDTYAGQGAGISFGDFNSDGTPDLIVAGGGIDAYPNVLLLLGNGDGSFQQAPRYATGRAPRTPVIGDFNGDDKLDLAVPNSLSNNVSVLLNNGDGTYGTNVNYFTGRGPSAIVVNDFNEDNKLDLIVANLNTNYVSLLLGNGNGTFQTNVIAASLFMLGAASVVTGDFNHDNNLDFAIPNFAGLKVFPGNGNGTFGAEITSSSALYTGSLTIGDFNTDNNPDIVVVNGGTSFITIFFGNANGTFQPPVTNIIGSVIGDVAIGDLNGDGKLDIAAADIGCSPCTNAYANGKVQVLLGNGNGTFQSPIGYLVDASAQATAVAIGDVNSDGKPDVIAVSRPILGFVWVLLNNGDGTFQHGVPFSGSAAASYLTAADVDGDGRRDILTANQNVDTISVLLNTCPVIPPASVTCTLTPALATNTVNTAHTVVATVTSNGTAKAGVLVNFSVTGANAGQAGTATTSASGLGTFTYTGTSVGPDTIRAIAGSATGTATKVWIAAVATHDLAVIKMKAPKKITLTEKKPTITGKFGVSIQNNGDQTEVIPDLGTLANLVTLNIQSLGACADVVPVLTTPKFDFPVNLAPKKKLKLAYTGMFSCTNMYRVTATVDAAVLGGSDSVPANDVCPRPANPATGDKGCGKGGAEVLINVIMK